MDIPFEVLDPVKSILELIESLTKKSFKFVRNDNLEVNATVRIARQGMPEHIITYKSESNE